MNESILKDFKIAEGFFGRYQKLVTEFVIPYQEKILNDEIPGIEKSHAIENFRAAVEYLETGSSSEKFYGMVFQDSDVAKWLEASAYSLIATPDKALEKRCDAVIDLLGKAQQPDGYLNTYFTVKEPGRRWTDLGEAHEMYCAGHLMEAAVAYTEATGKTRFLDIMCRMADHIYNRFITEQKPGYSGHPEIELALMRLYRCTGNQKYEELAGHFINVRGVDSDYFIEECKRRDWNVWSSNFENKEYMQCHKPVREQKEAVGHAVRAVYLYTGMADFAASTGDESLKQACRILWNNITQKRMYVTGAIGSAYEGEAFTKDYHLPNDSAYAETCAAVGLIFFGRRMLKIEKNSIYSDTIERALYNGVLPGMQLDGTKFFYVNPLEVVPGHSGEAISLKHALPQRPEWFACACCPPNAARLIESIGQYTWEVSDKTVFSHLFISSSLLVKDIADGIVHLKTMYPYDDTLTYTFEPKDSSVDIDLAIRLPFWSPSVTIKRNGKLAEYTEKSGYAFISGPFTTEDTITMTFDMSIRRIYANNNIPSDTGKVAFSRGPLIYCAEGVDNNGTILDVQINKDSEPVAEKYDDSLLNGIVPVKVGGFRVKKDECLYSFKKPVLEPCTITLIPYYAWGNRGLTQMRVWIPEI